MAIKTIGVGGDYTTIVAWGNYVRTIGTLTEDETGRLIDAANYPIDWADRLSTLDFSSVTKGAFEITLQGFGSGLRAATIQAQQDFRINNCVVEDCLIDDVSANFGGNLVSAQNGAILRRLYITSDSTGSSRQGINCLNSGTRVEACVVRHTGTAAANSTGIQFDLGSQEIEANTVIGFGIGYGVRTGTPSMPLKNNVAYNIGVTEYDAGTGNFTGATNNAGETLAASQPTGIQTNYQQITTNPFDVDGYTPLVSSVLDGTGTNLSIATDVNGNSFTNPPSIGAAEVIGGAPATPTVDDIDTDEIVTDGQQNATFTTSNFSSEITTVKLVSGTHETVCTGVTSTGGAGTFDIPDVSTFATPTVGCPFTSASHAVVAELSNA